MPMKLYAKPSDARTLRALAIAKINQIDIETVSGSSTNPNEYFGKIPVLDTCKGPSGSEHCVFTTTAICRYLARTRPDIGLYGQNFLESGEIDSWVDFASTELEVPLCAWTYPIMGIFPDVPEATQAAKMDVQKCLKVLNEHLLTRTYMAGNQISMADVHIGSILFFPMHLLKSDKKLQGEFGQMMKAFPNVARYYKLISGNRAFAEVFGISGDAGNQGKASQKGGKDQMQHGKKGADKKQEQQNQKVQKDKKQNQKPQGQPDKKPAMSDADKAAEKKKKASIKEGGKRGVELEGARDMGGPQFYNNAVLEPDGDLTLLQESVKAMNAKSDPTAEERKGGAGDIGKMIYSAGSNQLAIVCHVPKKLQSMTTAKKWLQATLKALKEDKAFRTKDSNDEIACALITGCNADKPSIKIKDQAILDSNEFLRSFGGLPKMEDVEEDDDEYVFGDDDFPS